MMMGSGKPWHPEGFSPSITLWAHGLLFIAAFTRGVDYAVGDSPLSSHRLGAVEESAPLWVWGALFAGTAALGFISMAMRHLNGVIVAHTMATGLYLAVGVGLVWDVMARAAQTNFGYSWPTILPIATVLVCIAGAARFRDSVSAIIVAGAVVAAGIAEVSVELDGLRNAVILLVVGGMNAVMASGTAQARERADIIREKVSDADT